MQYCAMKDTYTHGHHESVLRSHKWRTAQNSAAHLLPSLRSGLNLLDIGCGPGTITADLARLVAPGSVTGIDASEEVITAARTGSADSGLSNLEFAVGDLYALEYPEGSFDVVHVHQVLQHLSDPVGALLQMRRVLKPGGILAVRESDFGGFVWSPPDRLLDRWMELYHQVTRHNQAEADAGRFLLGWTRAAGFSQITPSSSTWTFADVDTRSWWGNLWADRVQFSSLGEQARSYGLATDAELADIADAWRRWAETPDGVFVALHCEVIGIR
jgi:ubiquinone/menaquinone biosynthesis C-methylase UbiE